jgi:S-adenosylmethionine:tRNA ribosyltransferase-isomerase
MSKESLQRLRGREITAVGTTSVRTLESLYWLGLSSAEGKWPAEGLPSVSQWEPYEHDSQGDMDYAINHLVKMMEQKNIDVLEATTDLIIIPGYRFRVVNSILTNFHQPGSTLLLLVAAFTGNTWKDIYSHALASGYRFLSYGDTMLLK